MSKQEIIDDLRECIDEFNGENSEVTRYYWENNFDQYLADFIESREKEVEEKAVKKEREKVWQEVFEMFKEMINKSSCSFVGWEDLVEESWEAEDGE